jgi:uncharacterized protein (TIGR03067 family)
MKAIACLLATFALTACAAVTTPPIATAAPAVRAASELPGPFKELQGVWVVKSAQRGSRPMPDKTGVKAHIEGNRFWFEGDPGHEVLDLDTSAAPFRMDFWDGGTAVQGVYRIEGNTLFVCSAPPDVARPAGFDPRADSRYILMVAERATGN